MILQAILIFASQAAAFYLGHLVTVRSLERRQRESMKVMNELVKKFHDEVMADMKIESRAEENVYQ